MGWIRELEDKIERMFPAIEHAKKVGTLNELDRSKQYTEPDPHRMLGELNGAWKEIRTHDKALMAKDARIADLGRQLQRSRLVNSVLTLVLLAIWEGIKLAGPWILEQLTH